MCRGRYNVEYTVNAGARCLLHVFRPSGVRFLLFFVCLVFLLIFLVPLGTFGSLFCLLSSTNWVPLGSGWAKIATIFIFFTQTLTAGGGEVVFFGVGLDATPPSRHEFGGLCTRSATVSRTSRTTVPPCHSSSDRISKPLLW